MLNMAYAAGWGIRNLYMDMDPVGLSERLRDIPLYHLRLLFRWPLS
jgi:hypothetical protein